jgi:hypothetical protein
MIRDQVIAVLTDVTISGWDEEDLRAFARKTLLDSLEKLSDGELRAECQCYGVPVSDE